VRAVRVEQFGIDNLQIRELPHPVPGAGEVLIATEAATVNPADAAVVSAAAAPRFARGAVGPYTPGWDLVGTITACGDGVSESLVRTRVAGCLQRLRPPERTGMHRADLPRAMTKATAPA
jgi:NADPH:quinone reductase